MRTADLDSDWYHKRIGGYIYAVEYADGLVKIGYSSNPCSRFDYLERYYRGRPMRIIREYVSDYVNKCRLYEARVMLGLEPCDKKELFCIPFYAAVKRIQTVVAMIDPEEDNNHFSD